VINVNEFISYLKASNSRLQYRLKHLIPFSGKIAFNVDNQGTAVTQWLRCCATNRKVAGSIPASVSGFFIDIKSFRSHYGRCVRLTTYHHPVPLLQNLGTLTS